MTRAYHQKKLDKPHGNAKWTRETFEPIMADIRNRIPRKLIVAKYNIAKRVLDRKITEYNEGVL